MFVLTVGSYLLIHRNYSCDRRGRDIHSAELTQRGAGKSATVLPNTGLSHLATRSLWLYTRSHSPIWGVHVLLRMVQSGCQWSGLWLPLHTQASPSLWALGRIQCMKLYRTDILGAHRPHPTVMSQHMCFIQHQQDSAFYCTHLLSSSSDFRACFSGAQTTHTPVEVVTCLHVQIDSGDPTIAPNAGGKWDVPEKWQELGYSVQMDFQCLEVTDALSFPSCSKDMKGSYSATASGGIMSSKCIGGNEDAISMAMPKYFS